MTKTLLPVLSALSGLAAYTKLSSSHRDPPAGRRTRGWGAGALEMLRADVTNVDYLVHGFCRR
jgi:hypothetical protein